MNMDQADKVDAVHEGSSEGGFIRNSIFLVSIEVFVKFLGLILFLLMARVLGAEDIGLYESSLALAGIFVLAVGFGFDRLVQRDVGRDMTLIYSRYREINVIKLLFLIVSLLVIWLILLLQGEPQSQLVMMISLFALIMPFSTFNNALFRGIGKPEYEVAVRLIFSLLNLGLGVFALYSGWGLLGVISMQLISIIASIVAAFFIIERTSRKVGYTWRWDALPRHIKRAAPFAALLVVLFLGNQITVVMLSALVKRIDVGYFAAPRRLFDSLTLIPMAAVGSFLPVMSRLYCTSLGRFTRTLRFTLKYMFVISAPLVVGTIIVARPLMVFLFKEQFEPAASALQLMMLALVFSFWNTTATALLIARNREGMLIWLFAAGAAVHIVGNLILIPLLSYNGASLAVAITQGIQFLIFYFATLKRYTNSLGLAWMLAGPALCTALMGASVYFALPLGLWPAILIGIVVYPAALLITRSANSGDLHSLQRILSVRAEIRPDAREK